MLRLQRIGRALESALFPSPPPVAPSNRFPFGCITGTKARKILNAGAQTTKEILHLTEQVRRIRKEKRWFIMPEEIENFPKILKAWHNFFFFEELA